MQTKGHIFEGLLSQKLQRQDIYVTCDSCTCVLFHEWTQVVYWCFSVTSSLKRSMLWWKKWQKGDNKEATYLWKMISCCDFFRKGLKNEPSCFVLFLFAFICILTTHLNLKLQLYVQSLCIGTRLYGLIQMPLFIYWHGLKSDRN